MRSSVEGLGTPYPLAGTLPAFMQEDPLVVQLTAGLDDVLAPVISVLDCLDAYLDPFLAPPDFVAWLGTWVGAPLDDHWEDPRRRAVVLAASELHRMRGTVEGLRVAVELATGGAVEVEDPGGVGWSSSPTGQDATVGDATLVIRVRVDDPAAVRLHSLDQLVSASKPAHVPHRIEVLPR